MTDTSTPVTITPPETDHVYHWVALYDDGTAQHELDPAGGPKRGWSSVDPGRVRWLVLQPALEGLQGHGVHVDLEAGERAFFTRRITHTVNPNTEPPSLVGAPSTVFIIGTQRADGAYALLYVTEQGAVTGTTNLNLPPE